MSSLKQKAIIVNKLTLLVFVYCAIYLLISIVKSNSATTAVMNKLSFFITGPLLAFLTILNLRYQSQKVKGAQFNRKLGIILVIFWVLAGLFIGFMTLVFNGLANGPLG